ncbi:GMC oxidoreductase [Parahaliea mediterranea]|uniref:GMC oxidoreductase n=1 Tax=Parahaliea mediterranea TaxID=651086 RepID=UPI000E2F7B55|nr:GMC oxidoreductase [Parahaliea mediterranea]
MIIDLEQQALEHNALRADVCIAGAGPAGIVLALELARARPDWHIVLCEAGGTGNATEAERDIYRMALGEKSYSVADICRRRRLGGTTAHWGGWSKPLDATDYEDNPAWDVPAWPITQAEVQRYMDSALAWTEITSTEFDLSRVRDTIAQHLLPLRVDGPITEHAFRFSPPTRFGTRYYNDINQQDNLTCLLHANLTRLDRAGERITQAEVKPLDGAAALITAEHFVLAMGGLETTRHLLNLRGEAAADGEGIFSDHLGRYFADHYGPRAGNLLAPEGLKYHRFSNDGQPIMPVLTFSADHIRKERQHNTCMTLNASSGEGSVLHQYGSQSGLNFKPGNYWQYQVQMIVEPRPNPLSRIHLTNERCALGLRRLKLDWQPHRDDFDSAYTFYQTLGGELSRTGLGRFQITRQNTAEHQARASGACHHLGTTRMAARPEDGVVDTDLKVFGSQNLYVASSSVFPRYGYSNPTLTIAALSVRLAQHLAGQKEAQA